MKLKKIILIVLISWLAIFLIGCQTVQGVGRDITWIGQATTMQ